MNNPNVTKLFRSTLRVLVDLGIRGGLSKEQIEKELADSVSAVTVTPPPLSSSSFSIESNMIVSSMIGVWARDREFVDDLGVPIPLPRDGAGASLAKLYQHAIRSMNSGAPIIDKGMAIQLLADRFAIVECGGGLWKRNAEAVAANTSDSIGVEMQLCYLAEYAGTVGYNITQPTGLGRFCAVAHVDAFPRDQVPLLNRHCWTAGMSFLKDVDARLVSAAEKHQNLPREELVRTGIGLYLIEVETNQTPGSMPAVEC